LRRRTTHERHARKREREREREREGERMHNTLALAMYLSL